MSPSGTPAVPVSTDAENARDAARFRWMADHEDAWPGFRPAMEPAEYAGLGIVDLGEFVDEIIRLSEEPV